MRVMLIQLESLIKSISLRNGTHQQLSNILENVAIIGAGLGVSKSNASNHTYIPTSVRCI